MSAYSIGYTHGLLAAKAALMDHWKFTAAVDELEHGMTADKLAKVSERGQAARSVAAIQALIDARDSDPDDEADPQAREGRR